MKKTYNTALLASLLLASTAIVAGEKDCLLKGTVERDPGAAANATQVKIHSVSRYDEGSRCNIRRNQKMEFKLPQDTRVQEAPSGSEVEYRYRQDEKGESSAELMRVGA